MKNFVLGPFWTAMLLAAMLMAGTHAFASPPAAGDKPAVSAKNKKTGASGQVRFLPGSAETAKERSLRLKRECRGQVNAGACSGYTR